MARTLEELAALSGVSRATVSRVINGGPVRRDRGGVSGPFERTNYRPEPGGPDPRLGRSGVVGVVVHVIPGTAVLRPLLLGAARGDERRPGRASMGMMLWLGNRSKEETLERDPVVACSTG